MNHFAFHHYAGDKAISDTNKKTVVDAIGAVSIKPGRGTATKIREQLIAKLKTLGWSGEARLAADSDMTITSVKDDTGLCLQTGNMSRIYADLRKLQTMYLNNHIKAAVIILPSHDMAKLLGDNIAQAKRLERELAIFKKAYHVPTVIYALES